MSPARTISVQSVLYETGAPAIVRIAESVANSAGRAVEAGVVSAWQFVAGDCSPLRTLTESQVVSISKSCTAAGGAFSYHFFDDNLGHGGGHNRLAALSESDLLLFLNPDALLGPEVLSELATSLTDEVGATDARQIPLEHAKTFEAGTGDESWASGACLMTPRAIFEELAGFDTRSFFMYCDDVDYSWRVRLAGHRVVYSPAARVFHDKRLDRAGTYEPSDVEVYYSIEAALFLAHKYSKPARVRSVLRWCRREGSPPLLRAVAEYESRLRSGTLPTPIDERHRVGEFVGQHYARQRY
jgi:GT2 family glycosyltransferase